MKHLYSTILILSLLFPSFNLYAQLGVPSAAALTIKISPEFPSPGSLVNAELISLNTDLSKANITWTVDGKIVARGTGEKKISFTAASRGNTNRVSATAISTEGDTFSTSITIRPQNIDFIVESKSKTPLWYRGASLPSAGSKIIVTALPDFVTGSTKISPVNLYYDWRVDNKPRKDLSGKGKQSIVTSTEGVGLPRQFEVKVTSSDGTLAHRAFYTVEAQQAEILFYKNSSDGPITSKALRTLTIGEEEKIQVQASPFFMNFLSAADLIYEWAQNGTKISGVVGNPQLLDITTEPDSSGQSATFSAIISTASNLLQKIGNSFNVEVN